MTHHLCTIPVEFIFLFYTLCIFYNWTGGKRDLQLVTYPVAARNPRGIIDSQAKIDMLPNRNKLLKTYKLKYANEIYKGKRSKRLEVSRYSKLTRWKVHQLQPQFRENTRTLQSIFCNRNSPTCSHTRTHSKCNQCYERETQ